MSVHIYTDGACRGNQTDDTLGAWGYVIVGDTDEENETGAGSFRQTTNNQMEMLAVIQALKAVKSIEDDIVIHSDSAYVVNCFKQKWYEGWRKRGWLNSKKKPVANRDMWETMLELVESRPGSVQWAKVKGHSGDKYNEMADDLCNWAMDRAERGH